LPSLPPLPREVGGLLIQIDLAHEHFLADHVVGGTPLLPTVMALDLMVRVACPRRPSTARVVVRDLEVGQPILVPDPAPLILDVTLRDQFIGAARVCEIVAPGTGAVHYRAAIETRPGRMSNTLPAPAPPRHLPVQPDVVYPPFFHGPTFQVIGGLGRVVDGFVVSMAGELPTLQWSTSKLQMRPRLLELLMQGCGLAAYAQSGRTMIPSGIELMTWYAAGMHAIAGAPEEPAVAHIFPRSVVPGAGSDTAAYDGVVVAADGEVLLAVEGYHAADLGVPRDLERAGELRARLDDSASVTSTTDAPPPQLQGVRT
jgi:hypothetical protein